VLSAKLQLTFCPIFVVQDICGPQGLRYFGQAYLLFSNSASIVCGSRGTWTPPPKYNMAETGNAVIVAEHDLRVIASSDWVIDIGPSAGEDGGRIIVAGTPDQVAEVTTSRTAPYLRPWLSLP
jgi:hypothetical protein